PRDDVDRAAHECGLDHGASFECTREVVALEPAEARPEPDVRVRRVLILDPGNTLERARDRHAHALEQELAREQRAVQLALGERALRHGRTLASRLESCIPCAAAIPPTTSAPPSASQSVTGSSRKIAPNVTASGGIAYAYVTARVGPRPFRPAFQKMYPRRVASTPRYARSAASPAVASTTVSTVEPRTNGMSPT